MIDFFNLHIESREINKWERAFVTV